MTAPYHKDNAFRVNAPNVQFSKEFITAQYGYQTTKVTRDVSGITVQPTSTPYEFRTQRKVPRTGVLLVGLGGNNGTTVIGGVLANKLNMSWQTKEGVQTANYFGSITQASTTLLGCDDDNREVFVPLKSLLPMVDPGDIVFGGWDINNAPLDAGMRRAGVFHAGLQAQLAPLLRDITPMPSIYYPDFIAANQSDRANHVVPGTRACDEHLAHIRSDIRRFREENQLENVIVLWTANTERFCEVTEGVHDTEANLMKAISRGHTEVPPSQMYAVAAILEGCAYINGAPQNTLVPAILEMAAKRGIFVGGDDFKSGQTKFKSVLVDFLVACGIRPDAIVSYNHLGNNDGKNLSSARQFRSKEITKRSVVDDMVESNSILYENGKHPDHCIVIKYVPKVGDSKRAMDEYTSTIFMNGLNTITVHNVCEDSLLAAPIIIDLIVLTELFQRVKWRVQNCESNNVPAGETTIVGEDDFKTFGSILTLLSFCLKAPLVPENAPLVNALFRQRSAIENVLRACIGLPPINHMLLEFKTVKSKL